MKTLVIGDIHGCHRELMDLLDRAGLGAEDEVIALGDIIDRGPDSIAVLDFFQTTPRARSIMGNHERKHIRSFRGETEPAISQVILREQFSPEVYAKAIGFLSGFPRFIRRPEAELIHGLLDPALPLDEQDESVLAGGMSGEVFMRRHYAQLWYELYRGPKPVVAGHHDYSKIGQPIVVRDLVYLIDTGCCYGHKLTGLLLPSFEMLSVKSRRNYWSEIRQAHARKQKAR